jgi:hypothetical protein
MTSTFQYYRRSFKSYERPREVVRSMRGIVSA